jgi:methylthioribose-1-phosphate isomerase
MTSFRSLEWTGSALRLLDQRQLPHQTVYVELQDPEAVAAAIQTMMVRGAPAIGVAAAFGLVLAANPELDLATGGDRIQQAAQILLASRPTAVNLAWAVRRMLGEMAAAQAADVHSMGELRQALLTRAQAIYAEDVETNRQIGLNAQQLIPQHSTVIHHCNTGALATVDYGTALGIIRIAHEQGKQVHAYLDETRPRLQGASLSAYELQAYGVPHTVIVDGAAAHVMRTRSVDCCLVGCDRIAANGDVANKIGTYSLALAAKAHGVPFYVACPLSTLDLTVATGDEIEIEERSPEEITHIGGVAIAPQNTPVFNPAFDITPAAYVSAIITEKGIVYPPFKDLA